MIKDYISQIQKQIEIGGYTEHTFRPALINLLEKLEPSIIAQNETERLKGVGMPDITIIDKENKDIKKGWIECKDLEVDLSYKKNQNQLDRYLGAFENFIYTNNLQFDFYRDGKLVDTVKIGSVKNGKLIIEQDSLISNNFEKLEFLLVDFLNFGGQTIKSAQALASAMSRHAKKISFVIENILKDKNDEKILKDQFLSMKKILIHDMSEKSFADMYSQTLVYGLFVARLNDSSLQTFSRKEAEKLIPKSNPFLRWLFQQIANDEEFDDRISSIIDDLVNIFRYTNVYEILNKSGEKDPIIHFYEDFLAEYSGETRKSRGVYYTPKPVVDFIIKNVDILLKQKFSISGGLADTEKLESGLHRVQVLDPATGTGTFLNGLIEYIYENNFSFMKGQWQEYVKNDLLPRMFGFELMMASYAMCHLRLFLTLKNLGYEDENERIGVYLTNSLEQANSDEQSFFSRQLAQESKEANQIKSTQPIMIVLGNPPYSAISSNMSGNLKNIVDIYKYIDGEYFNEKKHWLQDDYVKFIRFAEGLIEKNENGIVSYINPHGFLDNPTFRGMRRHLLKTFDEIYVLDLHGNAKKKEKSPDGSKDENVFDIQQGVSINFLVKSGVKKINELGKVFHYDLYGKREKKFEDLKNSDLNNIKWTQVEYSKPNYFFVPKNEDGLEDYEKGVPINECFLEISNGIITSRDHFVIDSDKIQLQKRIMDFVDKKFSNQDFQKKYNLGENYQRKISEQRQKSPEMNMKNFQKISYRPFDEKRIYYQENLVFRMRKKVLNNFIDLDNKGIIFRRQQPLNRGLYKFVSDNIISDGIIRSDNKGGESIAPLKTNKYGLNGIEEVSNINVKKFAMAKFYSNKILPEDIFNYIYGILNHRGYENKYNEFLKIDFPRIPLDVSPENFEKIKDFGHQLVSLHLMENITPNMSGVNFPNSGNSVVEKVSYNDEKVFINCDQYFENVPKIAREFFIGGYQPAQKYLKDRKGKKLTSDEIMHYMKIIYVLKKTDEIMYELEKVEF